MYTIYISVYMYIRGVQPKEGLVTHLKGGGGGVTRVVHIHICIRYMYMYAHICTYIYI